MKLRKITFSVMLAVAMMLPAGVAMAAPSVQIQTPVDGTIIRGIASTDFVEDKLDIVFIIDTSGSMGMNRDGPGGITRMEAVQQATLSVLNNFNSSVINVGIVEFSTAGFGGGGSRIVQSLTNDYNAVENAINGLQTGSTTPMGEGINFARQDFADNGRSDAGWIALLLSDGYSNCCIDPIDQATAAANEGITINTYGFGDPDEDLLTEIADLTGGTYLSVDTSNIDNIFDAGIDSEVDLDRVELTDGTDTWLADITSQIGQLWTWESPVSGMVGYPETTFTATAYWSDQSTAEDSVTVYCEGQPPVPEPTTMLLLGSGLMGLVGFGKKRKKK